MEVQPCINSGGDTLQMKRARHIQHILEKECVYVANLVVLQTIYAKNLIEAQVFDGVESLFDGLDQIIECSRDFNTLLCGEYNRDEFMSHIGSLFTAFGANFASYTRYVTHYEQSSRLIRQNSGNSRFQAILDRCSADQMAGGQDLTSLMIQPIQHIPRYALLLRDLKKYTDPNSPGYADLDKAIQECERVTTTLNEAVREEQNLCKVRMIQDEVRFCPIIENPNRRFIKDGYVSKVCRKYITSRYIVLFTDMLLYVGCNKNNKGLVFHQFYYVSGARSRDMSLALSLGADEGLRLLARTDKSKQGDARAAGKQLAEALSSTVTEKALALESTDTDEPDGMVSPRPPADIDTDVIFSFESPERSFLLIADSPQEKAEWVKAINTQAEYMASRKAKPAPHHLAPVWIPDALAPDCMVCHHSFSFFYRRHHCRCCGIVCCAACSKTNMVLQEGKEPQRVCRFCALRLQLNDGRRSLRSEGKRLASSTLIGSDATESDTLVSDAVPWFSYQRCRDSFSDTDVPNPPSTVELTIGDLSAPRSRHEHTGSFVRSEDLSLSKSNVFQFFENCPLTAQPIQEESEARSCPSPPPVRYDPL